MCKLVELSGGILIRQLLARHCHITHRTHDGRSLTLSRGTIMMAFSYREPASQVAPQGSIASAQASVGTAAGCPMTGTILITADATRHGAATSPQPETAKQIRRRARNVLMSSLRGTKRQGPSAHSTPPISANFARKRRAGRLTKRCRLSNSSMQKMARDLWSAAILAEWPNVKASTFASPDRRTTNDSSVGLPHGRRMARTNVLPALNRDAAGLKDPCRDT
jgi:hypothetical protein